MGAYFLVVNPAKRQYLDPGRFGEAVKFDGLLRGEHCLLALKLLISDHFKPECVSFPGAWLGDPVVLASDEAGLPNPGGLITEPANDLLRNLHARASAEFTNISYRALAELCLDAQMSLNLAIRAKADRSLLIDLGSVLQQYHPGHLEHSLEEAVGRPWRKEYNKALAELPYWQPLPGIDWPM